MPWTREQIEQIPEVYRDFMVTLWPIIRSRQDVLRINGIPLGRVLTALSTRYDYNPEQIRKIADNLEAGGWVAEDKFGFFTPTAKGETLIKQLMNDQEVSAVEVPPLPKL